MTIEIILACLGSSGLFAFLTFLIQRKDNKLDKRLDKMERDSVRTQILILMNHYPDNVQEIMKISQYYFETLNGDWYMTSLFNQWLEKNQIAEPEWFTKGE